MKIECTGTSPHPPHTAALVDGEAVQLTTPCLGVPAPRTPLRRNACVIVNAKGYVREFPAASNWYTTDDDTLVITDGGNKVIAEFKSWHHVERVAGETS